MRIIVVWITALTLMTFITIGWYVSNFVVNIIASSNMDLIGYSGESFSLLRLLEYVNIAWGPFFDFLVLLWAITYPSGEDAISGYRY